MELEFTITDLMESISEGLFNFCSYHCNGLTDIPRAAVCEVLGTTAPTILYNCSHKINKKSIYPLNRNFVEFFAEVNSVERSLIWTTMNLAYYSQGRLRHLFVPSTTVWISLAHYFSIQYPKVPPVVALKFWFDQAAIPAHVTDIPASFFSLLMVPVVEKIFYHRHSQTHRLRAKLLRIFLSCPIAAKMALNRSVCRVDLPLPFSITTWSKCTSRFLRTFLQMKSQHILEVWLTRREAQRTVVALRTSSGDIILKLRLPVTYMRQVELENGRNNKTLFDLIEEIETEIPEKAEYTFENQS